MVSAWPGSANAKVAMIVWGSLVLDAFESASPYAVGMVRVRPRAPVCVQTDMAVRLVRAVPRTTPALQRQGVNLRRRIPVTSGPVKFCRQRYTIAHVCLVMKVMGNIASQHVRQMAASTAPARHRVCVHAIQAG